MATLAIEIDKDRLRDFCRRWKITEFALFGSSVRPGEFRPDSDVDVLVTFAAEDEHDFGHYLQMKDELRDIFGRDVDIASRSGVEQMRNYLRREAILESAVPLDLT
jgi:predicted nucleotidyltransferase